MQINSALKIRAMQLGILPLEPLDTLISDSAPLATRLYLTAMYAFHPDIHEIPYITSIIETLESNPTDELRKYGAFSIERGVYLILALLIRHADESFLPRLFDLLMLEGGVRRICLFHIMLPRMTDELWDYVIQASSYTNLYPAIRWYIPTSFADTKNVQVRRPPISSLPAARTAFDNLMIQPPHTDSWDEAVAESIIAQKNDLNDVDREQLLKYLHRGTVNERLIKLITLLYPYLDKTQRKLAFDSVIRIMQESKKPEPSTKEAIPQWLLDSLGESKTSSTEDENNAIDFELVEPLFNFVSVSVSDLSVEQLRQLLFVIHRVEDAAKRISLLVEIVDYVDEQIQAEIYQHTFESVRKILSFHDGAHAEEIQAPILANLANIAPQTYLSRAVEIAGQFRGNMEKSYVLHAIALRLQGDERQKLMHSALRTAFADPTSVHPMSLEPVAFYSLLPFLPRELVGEVLELVQNYSPLGRVDKLYDNMRDATLFERDNGLTSIAPYLSTEAIRELLNEMT